MSDVNTYQGTPNHTVFTPWLSSFVVGEAAVMMCFPSYSQDDR